MTEDFYEPLRKAIKLSGKSLREISRETGIARSKLADVGKKGRLYADEMPLIRSALSLSLEEAYGPEFFSHSDVDTGEMFSAKVDILARQLVNSAISRAREALRTEVAAVDVINWWESVGGRLTECDQLMTNIITFKAVETPDAPMIALHVGNDSLPRKSLNTQSPEAVTEYAASLNDDAKMEICSTYHRATTQRRWIMEPREMEIKFRTVPNPFVLRHSTIVLPVTAANGETLLISFSEFISARPILPEDGQQ